MLDTLGIDEKRRLKCNAHIILATDVALDKVFRDIETKVGPSKLIGLGASHVFSSPSNSIWYLGLIAIAKLFSPSHSKESISLYSDYMRFLDENESIIIFIGLKVLYQIDLDALGNYQHYSWNMKMPLMHSIIIKLMKIVIN